MANETKTYVVGVDMLVRNMFSVQPGFTITDSLEESDLVVFTGGADVSPNLYGEKRLSVTKNDADRDNREIEILNKAEAKKKVGICRGGQFLNVMSGGKMYQDVDNHAGRSHIVYLAGTNRSLGQVTSTHHQMMRMHPSGKEILYAKESQFRTREKGTFYGSFTDDLECVFYEKQKALCFQPHPEYNCENTRLIFFNLLQETLGV